MPSRFDSSRISEMPGDSLLRRELGDLLDEARLVHLVRQLGNDDGLAAAPHLLGVRLGPQRDGPPAGRVGFADAARAVDVAARREVRPLDDLQQLLDRRLGVVDQGHEPVDDLGEVVRRDVGGHAHRDARGAVDQEVRNPRWQDHRLPLGLVEVRDEVDGVAVDVGQHLVGDLGQARLGVAHRRRRVTVDRPIVPLPVDQRIAERELLHHAHERLVDRRVAVRMVLAHAVADDARRLLVRAVPVEPEPLHRVEDASVDRLEAVADVRQRAADDDGHRVVQIGLPHFLFDRDWNLALIRHRQARDRASGAPRALLGPPAEVPASRSVK